MMRGCELLLVAACLGSAVCAAPAWTWSPMFMPYMRPRRAPAPGAPGSAVPVRPPPPPSAQGMPLYPSRTLSFSGYFSGAGVPQAGDPYGLTWGPPLSFSSRGLPCDGMCKSVREEQAAAVEENPEAPPEEAASGGAMNPTVEPVPEATPYDTEEGNGDSNGFETRRAKQDPPRRQPKPSYPAPAPAPAPGPHNPSPVAPAAPAAPAAPSGGPDENDRGGYGTINAWFPFMFSGGWPMGGEPNARGYGAPSNPSYGAPSNPSYGAPSSPGLGSAAQEGGAKPQSTGGSSGRPGAPGGPGGYYPVAIANSFSTGRNAMASSTATAYGGSPGRS